jgi:hypothetical protein
MDRSTSRIYTLVAWASLFTIVVVSIYGVAESLYGSKQAVGEVLVDVYWPITPIFAQPVTYFSVASVALFYSGLRLGESRIEKWPAWLLSFLQLFGFIVAFSSAYEVLYNFMLWGATYSILCVGKVSCNPDTFSSTYPVPWNLVFATRAFSALFVISGYSVYFIRRISGSRLM